jgi:geranylgeranyl diphosphate synthase type I
MIVNSAKQKLNDYVKEIDVRLARYFDSEINLNFGFNNRQKTVVRELLAHSREHNLRPSKRLRGSFVHYGYQLGGQKADQRVWQAAMGVELVHTALLMHDDFMDQDNVRRGGATTHKFYEQKFSNRHFGESMAVNVGDAILCLGFELIDDNRCLRAIAQTAYGQAYDVTLEMFKNWTEDDVLSLHRAKTAIYTYENPLLIGARLAKLTPEVFEILHQYSMDGGVAFQLQDDILGVFGNEQETGKSADSDLKQGKCTLLVLKALNRPEVMKVWGDANATRQDLDDAKQAIVESGSRDYSRKLAQDFAAKAAQTADKLKNLNLNSEAIDYIQGIAEYMVEREV